MSVEGSKSNMSWAKSNNEKRIRSLCYIFSAIPISKKPEIIPAKLSKEVIP